MKKTGCAALAAIIIISIVFTALPGVFSLRADAVSASGIQNKIDSILESEVKRAGAKDIQAMLDNKYASAPAAYYWNAFAIIQYKGKECNYSEYAKALKTFNPPSDTTKKFIALLFAAMNTNEAYVNQILKSGSENIMEHIYALHLIANCHKTPDAYAKKTVSALLGKQLEDGGWALSGDKGTVDVTAMTIQALAHFRNDADVKKTIDRGLSALSAMQQSDGGFTDSGKKNPESAAQVIVALTALGINPLTDSRFIKGGKSPVDAMLAYKLSDGGFTHDDGKYNSMATVQALYSLVSIYRLQKGTGALYDIDTNIKLPKDSGGQVYITTTTTLPVPKQDNTTSTTRAATKKAEQTTAVYSSYSRRTTTRPDKTSSTKNTEKTTVAVSSTAERKTTAKPEKPGTTAPSKQERTKPSMKEEEITSVTYSESFIEEEETTYIPDIPESETQTVTEETVERENKTSAHDDENEKNSLPKIKIYLILGVWALALAGAAVLIIKKNKKAINYIIIFAVAAAGTAGIFFGDIKTPDEYYKTPGVTASETVTVTMSITCETVAGEGEESITPSDGIILPETEFTLDEGSTVYDCLIYAAKKYKIQIEDNTQTLTDHSRAYIAGINYLYEFDYGNLSGWMYSVNGEFADRGCGEYTLSDGDNIKWQYTRNIGDDLK